MSFFAELKRRNVFRVGIAYVLIAWVLLQAADFALDLVDAPNWVIQVFVIAVAAGLPLALVFAWAYEMTPEGIRREKEVDRTQSITQHTGRKLNRMIIGLLVLVPLFYLVRYQWYPEDLFYLDGGIQGMYILVAVDLVLGPGLTFLAYDIIKSKQKIAFDLSVIAILQVSALACCSSAFLSRPTTTSRKVGTRVRLALISANPATNTSALWAPFTIGALKAGASMRLWV